MFSLSEDPQHSFMQKNLSDRFKINRSKPPLVEIGGMRAKDGWVAISETGLVSYLMCMLRVKIISNLLNVFSPTVSETLP